MGLIFLGIGLIQLLEPKSKIKFIKGQEISSENNTKMEGTEVFVDVSGAVAKPQVYTLSDGSRIKDVLVAAGGLAEDADREYIAKNLNLAQKVQDGQKIYIPFEGENVSGTNVLGVNTNLVNINTATLSDLDKLPGVGQVTAQKIIDARPFSTVDDLKVRKIVNSKVFETIKNQITAN